MRRNLSGFRTERWQSSRRAENLSIVKTPDFAVQVHRLVSRTQPTEQTSTTCYFSKNLSLAAVCTSSRNCSSSDNTPACSSGKSSTSRS